MFVSCSQLASLQKENAAQTREEENEEIKNIKKVLKMIVGRVSGGAVVGHILNFTFPLLCWKNHTIIYL